MFVGRKTELKFLQDKYNSPKAQLVILYGRRRVGKTETLREFCRGKPHVFYSCIPKHRQSAVGKVFSADAAGGSPCQAVHLAVL